MAHSRDEACFTLHYYGVLLNMYNADIYSSDVHIELTHNYWIKMGAHIW